MPNESKYKVNICFFGPIMGIVGRSSDSLTVSSDKISVIEVIHELCEKYGSKFEEIALNKGKLNSGLIVFVNGHHITDPTYLIASVRGDELQLMIASQMKGG